MLVTWDPDTTANFVAGKDCSRAACMHDTPIKPVPTNSSVHGWFKSEFGCVTWSSFESLEPMLIPDSYGLHTPSMFERNWPVDNVIRSYFGLHQDLNQTGEVAFKRRFYQLMIAQALFIKSEIDGWRSINVWGTLVWQFNEIADGMLGIGRVRWTGAWAGARRSVETSALSAQGLCVRRRHWLLLCPLRLERELLRQE
jgi:hypothetical protein